MKRTILVALWLLTAGRSLAASTFSLLISSPEVLPGQTVRLELDNVLPGIKCRVQFRDKWYRFYAVGPDAQRALIGVPLGTDPGTYPLHVEVGAVTTTGPQTAPWTIKVQTPTYETENVNFKPEKTALMKAERREGAIIHRLNRIATPDQLWEGQFIRPVDGPIIGKYGLLRLRNGKIHAGFHKGVDQRSPEGTPLLAANAGTVVLSSPFRAHGKTVMIDHGQGVMTIYLHMSSLWVKPGHKVTKGQTIGKVGSTGLSTAPHVHWQVFVHGVPVDPLVWTVTEF